MSRVLWGEGDLFALADGTVIVWNRIEGDDTSKAVAFVHSETTDDLGFPEPVVLWVSPGGWMPMSPTGADIRYPAMALGTVDELAAGIGTPPLDDALLPLMAVPGGMATSAIDLRVEALKAAAQVWSGATVKPFRGSDVMGTADEFLAWLERHPIDTALADIGNPFESTTPPVVVSSDRTWFDDARTKALFHTIRDAITAPGISGPQALQAVVDILDHWTAATPPPDGQ